MRINNNLKSFFLGAVLLCSIQGLAVNIDPILYTWLTYQPQKRASRHTQQVRNIYNLLLLNKSFSQFIRVMYFLYFIYGYIRIPLSPTPPLLGNSIP